ncbi:TPA: copper resistance protein [Salmonella enterica]|nr:copper resistance protein [Salmonella enterica]
MINDGHYFPVTGGIPTDGLNEPLTFSSLFLQNIFVTCGTIR